MIKQYNVENVNIQYQMVVVSPCVDRTVRIVFFSVYNNPNNSVHQLLSDLERLLAEIPSNLTAFIVGDFNVDILCKSNSSQKLMNMFKYYGFHQLCKPPSHRRGGGSYWPLLHKCTFRGHYSVLSTSLLQWSPFICSHTIYVFEVIQISKNSIYYTPTQLSFKRYIVFDLSVISSNKT